MVFAVMSRSSLSFVSRKLRHPSGWRLAISILFPVYWLAQDWELLVTYLPSAGVLLVSMMRFECTRCEHTQCAHNTAARQG